VGAGALGRVLHRLRHDTFTNPDVLAGLDSPDDAAIVAPPLLGHVSIQTVSSLSDQPETFLQIKGDTGHSCPYNIVPILVNVTAISVQAIVRQNCRTDNSWCAQCKVDFFRASVSDPWLFGRVAAEHALSDCWAMGAAPATALAIAVVPYAAEAQARPSSAAAQSVQSAGGTILSRF